MARNVDIVCSEHVPQTAAERIAAAARAGGQIVLTGGRSVAQAYELAAVMEPDWSNVEIWFTDERCVPTDHEWSNYRQAKEALLDRVTPHAVHRMHGELGKDEGAARYEQQLAVVDRITLTFPMLRSAREMLFVVTGEDKADACARAFDGEPTREIPGSLVRAIDGVTTAVLDPAAAAKV